MEMNEERKICKNKVEAEAWFTGLSALICRGQHGSQVQHIDGIWIAGLPFDNLKSSKDALLAGIDGGDASAAEAERGSEKSTVEKELEQLTSILPGLEKKLEDLSEANPSADMDEMVKAIASRVTEVMPKAASFTSSQIATSSNGFDSSVMSTAATTRSSGSTVTDLGVVGTGVKRASIKPISAEPAAKKPALDSPSLQGDSSINSEVVPATQTDESS
uniref:Tetratricopeptide repeat (TPR)-like superfamily protein n=1 Tax=Zea mays TaxID=4577 RepID=A0A804RIC9_MAIZE